MISLERIDLSMMNYTIGQGNETNWIVAETAFDARYQGKCEAIFTQGNGYLGQRATLEESYVGRTPDLLVTGTFDAFDGREVTELPNLPDMTGVTINIDGHPFSMLEGKVEHYLRTLNLHNGLLERDVIWVAPTGKKLHFHFSRFVSLAREHVMALRMDVTPMDADVKVSIVSGINGTVTNAGTQHFHEGTKRLFDLRIMRMTTSTVQSEVACCEHAVNVYSMNGVKVEQSMLPIISRRYIANKADFDVATGHTLRLEKFCTVCTARDQRWENEAYSLAALEDEGLSMVREAETVGFDALFTESAEGWKKLWEKIDITIKGSDFDQLAIRFAQYHMNIFVKKDDNRVGIGAKGMSGEGYKGHSFWDTEIFILPYFLFSQPEVARTLLEYRYNTLSGARKKAKENHYIGAMYPWESAWKDDGEVTPLWGDANVVTGEPTKIWTGILELHISADIAFAVQEYFRATGDQDFMDRCGYEIVIDTARFWASRAEWNESKGVYEYTDVIGPDEYKDHVDNNAYTNHMAGFNMRLALKMMDELRQRNDAVYTRLNSELHFDESEQQIKRVLDKLYLPRENADGILPQFDHYFDLKSIDLTKYKQSDVVGTIYHDYSHDQIGGIQVGKQADVLALFFLLEELFSADVKTKNFYFYESRTLHDSSLSRSTHAVLAADLGLADMAYHLFDGATKTDLGPVMTTSDAGIHAASMGGIWQGTVYGFGGVRIVNNDLRVEPKLPEKWTELVFPLYWQGQKLTFTITHNEVKVENHGAKDVTLLLCGKSTVVPAGKTVVA